MSHQKIDLMVIVNGQPTTVEAEPQQPLHSFIGKALEQTGNTGQPAENWEFRDAGGQLIDANRPAGDFSGVKLFLNLKAGVGG